MKFSAVVFLTACAVAAASPIKRDDGDPFVPISGRQAEEDVSLLFVPEKRDSIYKRQAEEDVSLLLVPIKRDDSIVLESQPF
ncbi:hypothetical protein DL96DRAFT_1707743 [Flagelloscypha sp. PMI_526]|nr:hypothetical protein DL96DRAFT_1707743 [Flagelloscypha sp. PMI_526]